MKKIIVVLAILAASTSTGVAHEPSREDDQRIINANCIACCLASRPHVSARLRIDEQACSEVCGRFVRELIERASRRQ